ncbi:MAG: PTS system mannose/fructose/sorbose family transporter subunit IID [Breznakia sp.]
MSNTVLTKKDITTAAYRWQMMSCSTLNYEVLQGGTFAYSLAPALRKIYQDDEEFKSALLSHYRYFNSNPWTVNVIIGAVLALEDSQGSAARDTIIDFKTSMMGPLAGIGDTLIFVLFPTIMGSLSGYMLLEGNPLLSIIWSAMWVILFFLRTRLVHFGYNKGLQILSSLGSKINTLTEAASVLGLVVVGGLISGVVNINVPLTFTSGEVTQEIQPLIDQVMPSMLPVIFTFICYQLLAKKNVSMSKLIIVVIVFAMVAAFFGVLSA